MEGWHVQRPQGSGVWDRGIKGDSYTTGAGKGKGGVVRDEAWEVKGQLRKGLLRHLKSFQLYSEGTEELWEDFKLETATIRLAFIKILIWDAE